MNMRGTTAWRLGKIAAASSALIALGCKFECDDVGGMTSCRRECQPLPLGGFGKTYFVEKGGNRTSPCKEPRYSKRTGESAEECAAAEGWLDTCDPGVANLDWCEGAVPADEAEYVCQPDDTEPPPGDGSETCSGAEPGRDATYHTIYQFSTNGCAADVVFVHANTKSEAKTCGTYGGLDAYTEDELCRYWMQSCNENGGGSLAEFIAPSAGKAKQCATVVFSNTNVVDRTSIASPTGRCLALSDLRGFSVSAAPPCP